MDLLKAHHVIRHWHMDPPQGDIIGLSFSEDKKVNLETHLIRSTDKRCDIRDRA